jgi:hypothetical protein
MDNLGKAIRMQAQIPRIASVGEFHPYPALAPVRLVSNPKIDISDQSGCRMRRPELLLSA